MDLSSSENVDRIVQGCIRGDNNCQRQLYEAVYGKMLGLCLRYASDREEAKDLLHDGFIKVFEKMNNFKHTGSFEGWIRRIIVNNAIDYFRKNKKMYFEFEGEHKFSRLEDDSDNEIEEMKIAKLKAERIIELIQELTPSYRTVFNLYVVEDYSHKEIAEMLNISIGTSKSNLAKAKAKLKLLYEKYYENSDE
ncbi:MAG: sigma-70 family RNA polymerase sigma factor [Bacteroidales bacterium]|nr:sigma-70 family RNA polymerase sigma factor [Bacteroidales bacterium]